MTNAVVNGMQVMVVKSKFVVVSRRDGRTTHGAWPTRRDAFRFAESMWSSQDVVEVEPYLYDTVNGRVSRDEVEWREEVA